MNIGFNETASAEPSADRASATPAELDEVLLREIAKGNQLAIRTLFLRHQVLIYRFVLRIVRDRALAEDVVSEVFLAVWRQADRFQGRSMVSTWLLSIARHKALSAIRREPLEPLDRATAAAIADLAPTAEAQMGGKDRDTILRRCLAALSSEHGEIIDLVYYQQKSIKEIAQILAIPANTVKTRMFYARRRLGTLLQAAGIDRALT